MTEETKEDIVEEIVFDADLSMNEILAADDLGVIKLAVPEWKGNVYIRIMPAEERSEMEDLFARTKSGNKGSGAFRKEMIRRVLVDKNQDPMITDDAIANAFMTKNSLAVERIFEAGCSINGFMEKDVTTLKKK